MTNVDIGSLRHDMVQGQYLIRKRVKTASNDNVPVVGFQALGHDAGFDDRVSKRLP